MRLKFVPKSLKNLNIFLALFFLVSLTASAVDSKINFSGQTGFSVKPETGPKKLFARLNLGFGGKSFSYDISRTFTQYWEDGSLTEHYDIDSKGLAFELGAGFFFIKYLGLELSFAPGSGESTGDFKVSFPHPLYFNEFRETEETDVSLKYGASELNMNLIIRYPGLNNLHVYASVGGTYFLGLKVESLETFTWSETSYPYDSMNVSFETKEFSKSSFGFNLGGGIDFYLMDRIAINLNLRYSMGSVTIKLEKEGLAEAAEFTIKPGGLRALLGVKFAVL